MIISKSLINFHMLKKYKLAMKVENNPSFTFCANFSEFFYCKHIIGKQ